MRSDWARVHAEIRPHLERIANDILRDEHEAEDAVQDAFLGALEKSASIAAPEGWLVRVTQRRAIDRVRARTRRRHVAILQSDAHAAAARVIPDGSSALPESCPELKDAVALLPRALRRVVRLRLEGMQLHRIAAAEGISLVAATTRMSRARSRISEALT